ncbi:hypothetical protein D7318_03185 [Streptomyces radicis]|uniref:Lipoprotein n=1 Tax=Streptomyces radicis TaxID=1750517 RepID=A0ABX9RNT4_9ACTN|nr:hypothetical protein D7318_03185 [Streptomyces radicis]
MFAVAASLLVAGCGGRTEVDGASGDGSGQSTSGEHPSEHGDEGVTAYLAMWEDATVASWTSDANHPRLNDHATDEALMLLEFVLEENAGRQQVSQGAPKHDVQVVESSAERRRLRDCMDETDWLLYDSDGELVNSVPGSHRWVHATVERRDAQWIVTDLVLEEQATC